MNMMISYQELVRTFPKTAYEAANQPKELLIVKDATHVDLYDHMDKIPFDNITAFFNKYLNK